MICESNPPAFDVAVCGTRSLLTQTTVSPACDRQALRLKTHVLHRDRVRLRFRPFVGREADDAHDHG